VKVDDHEYINLVGRSLKTIPIVLHTHANTIVSLNLSRNPMLEIPLDFIQSCTTLRELRLSNMAMKKVPQSIRHSGTLNRLDISCNRIAELDDAGLERIPYLTVLKAHNNRIEKLPAYFAQLRALTSLNISNNKFKELPAAVSELTELKDLDISFNTISSLPEEIGQLWNLERLVIVGNQISRFPEGCKSLVNLVLLDCRRNNLSDLSLICKLPRLETLYTDHNAVHAVDLVVGPRLTLLDASSNDITQLRVMDLSTSEPCRLTYLNISHAKLSSLDGLALSHLLELKELRLAHNQFRALPDTIGALEKLEKLCVSDNRLDALPDNIGDLKNLRILDAHNNSLLELPASMWQCTALEEINVTSNLIVNWNDPPGPPLGANFYSSGGDPGRKPSTAGSVNSTHSYIPPLARSLHKLYLGENRLADDALHPLTILRELRVLNLSFNGIQELPPSFFRHMKYLEEIYLSGNNLSTIPTENLTQLERLSVMFLNGNKMQVLPSELASLKNLTVMDVGSNMLKYNIINHEFDWNW
jgi:adenylate cyclase